MSQPKVYITVLNYKNWKDTNACILSLSKLNYSNFEIIVVDNNSENGSVEEISNFIISNNIPRCSLIPHIENKGYAAGNNVGIKYALTKGGASFFWILNNDTEVESNSLDYLIKFNISKPSIKIMGNTLLFHHNPSHIQALGGGYNKWFGTGYNLHEGEVWDKNKIYDFSQLKYPVGASIFVSNEFITKVGLMTEDYFLFYEEIDWIKRGEKYFNNFIGICTEAIVYHKEGASMGNNKKEKLVSAFSDYYSLRNRIKFARRFYFYTLPVIYIGFFGVILNRIKRGQFDRILFIIKFMLTIGK